MISYSAWSKYLLCPHMYNIYYNERLEPKATTSALVFGSALDEGLNQLYLTGADPIKVFQDNFKYKDMKNVVFHKKDLNMGLFTQDQADQIASKDDHYKSWAALRIRGRVLIEHYMKEFFPKVTKVHGVQAPLSSKRRGFLDLKAEVEMEPGVTFIIDHKTSYYEYDDNAANVGAQLVLYAAEEKVPNVAYCVLLKDIRTKKNKTCTKCGYEVTGGSHQTCNKEIEGKRCHGEWEYSVAYFPRIQWIQGKPSKHMKDTMQTSIKIVEKLAEDKVYPRNYATCNFVFGRQCEYHEYCHFGKKTGLKTREKK